jgi:hypothetical protein
VTTAEQEPDVALTVMLAGQVMAGFSLSLTVIVNEQLAVFPDASVAVCVTVVVPTGKESPLAKPAVRLTETPEQLSLAAGVV